MKKKKQVLIDVREPSEFESKHIHGSHNIPLSDLDKHKEEISKIDKDITLVCRTGSRAETACELLKKQGAKNVDIMPGGIVACDSQGHRIVMGTQKWDIERQVRFTAGLLIVIGVLLGHIASSYFFLLPAFVGLGLIFASITNTCTMAMLLMKMPYNAPIKKASTKETIRKIKKQ